MPFVMLAVCFVSSLISTLDFYPRMYEYLSQTVGCSVLTNIYFLYFISRHKMCAYSLVATIGLLALNLSDIAYAYHPFGELIKLYTIILSGFFLLLTTIFFIKYKNNGK